MRIAFRVDASVQIGLGHLARCLSLAFALRDRGGEVLFVTRDLGLDETGRIEAAGFARCRLPAPGQAAAAWVGIDDPPHAEWARVPWHLDVEQTTRALAKFGPAWIVVDHYAFDERWHRIAAAETGARLCLIDDLADRPLSAQILVDPNLAADQAAKHATAAADAARVLFGPRFALLGPRYSDPPHWSIRQLVQSIGIFMGGTDPLRLSELALRACRTVAEFNGMIEVATTRSNPYCRELGAACDRYGPARLLVDEPDLAAFHARHDLQIGAGGGAAWERCRVGVPTIALAFAKNQKPVVAALAEHGAAETVPTLDELHIGRAVRRLLDMPGERQRLSDCAKELVDGRGAERVALAMLAETLTLSAATPVEADFAYRWRNDERTRRYFRDRSPVPRETHDQWWARTLAGGNRTLLVARCGGAPVGFVRLDDSGNGSAEISFYLDPELTGLGLGSAALRAVQRWMAARQDLSRIVAHVLPENTASANAFAAAGFARLGDSDWRWERTR